MPGRAADAQLRPGDTLLDVGAGDGLIAFGALERLGPLGHVIDGMHRLITDQMAVVED
jgi:precorrin-6B methylase 2